MREHAVIVQSHGKGFVVELPDGTRRLATARRKKTDYAVGDEVELAVLNAEQAVIEGVQPRRTLLYRSDAMREKLIAANVTQIAIVVAAVPSFYESLVSRCLVAAEDAGLRALIVLNKVDLPETAVAAGQLAPYAALGYPVVKTSVHDAVTTLAPWLKDQHTVLVGQSGMGKSSLINALLPDAAARTGEISTALDSGRHTTTHATRYRLDATSTLIDSPGLQEFGLKHLDPQRLASLFPEFRPLMGQCRFHNCRHDREPGCALVAAVEAGRGAAHRLELLRRLWHEAQPASPR
jgi:ribosome biogenesis GTPase